MKQYFMKSLIALIGVCLVLVTGTASAQQASFLEHGRIEFEKKRNMHAMLDEMFKGSENSSWLELSKKEMPKFTTTYFDLYFAPQSTLYKPGRENPDNIRMRESPADANVIYTSLPTQETVAQKKVFEQLFLVKDSLRQIKWKITDETRKIAGFDCRRANAIIMDSIYVVAYYTDAIITPGGPESFTGLPGMILGLAMPHEHVTWFATKVLIDDIKEETLKPATKGKKVNSAELKEIVSKSLKDWGNYGKVYIKDIML
ncbi:GLPGLI family protein [Chitinophaga niastensis]|uniref:GLPGLI family protein n=1 Tax=Chitinophaga niastensis TaxID=536980 RepID=A0A2P8HPT4_CHINA|nr:GLPGLI family protein [Chitinophaga niastensis]PSL48221.1 GLPGLI family protein [Chitinophaga niastensis]